MYRGWPAWVHLEGQPARGRWADKIDTCVRFHRAIADCPRPAFFDRRARNPWVIADEVAWGEREIDHHPRIAPAVERLRAVLRPVREKSQLIHGDFGGNVLFSDCVSPAVIDFSPYWRPVEFAIGVIVADAIVWGGADESLMGAGEGFGNFYQHLARAELRRVVELEVLHSIYGWDMIREIDAHLPLVGAIRARCA